MGTDQPNDADRQPVEDPHASAAGALRSTYRPRFGLRSLVWCTLDIGEAVFRCWGILASFVVVAAVIAFVPQGFESLLATVHIAFFLIRGLFPWGALCCVTVLTVSVAVAMLDPDQATDSYRHCPGRTATRRFAAYTTPALLGLMVWFSFPYLLGDVSTYSVETGKLPGSIDFGFWMTWALIVLFPLPLVIMARDFGWTVTGALTKRADAKELKGALAWGISGLGVVVLICYFFVDSILIIFGLYAFGFVVRDWFLWQYQSPEDRKPVTQLGVAFACLFIGGAIFVSLQPAARTMIPGPVAVIFLAVGAWLSIAFFAILLCRRLPPIIGNVVALVFISLLITGPLNLRNARVLTGNGTRTTLANHAASWLQAHQSDIERHSGQYPIFVITAEGGGIRAAYWAASLLARLRDANENFS